MTNKRIKVMTVFGVRPEATKMCPLIKELEKNKDKIDTVVCVTAQHREMLDQVLNIFEITPDYDLNIMQKGQTLSDVTVRVLKGLEEVIIKESPDIVLVHGDPTTSFAASLAAFYQKTKVGHVEAGLRTYNKYEPFPEEINRKLVGAIADLHFAPTALSKEHLLKENIAEDSIFVTGNTAIDCIKKSIDPNYVFEEKDLQNIDWNKRVITMTAHRNENLGEPLENIFRAICRITELYDDILFVYPVHRNPLVVDTANKIFKGNKKVLLTNPVNMTDLHNLMNKSYFVVTDSGGLQEEAPALHKPVILFRNVTERPEGVTAGTLKLAGTNEESVFNAIKTLLDDKDEYNKMASAKNPFGDGEASKRIVDAILYHFNMTDKRPPDYLVDEK